MIKMKRIAFVVSSLVVACSGESFDEPLFEAGGTAGSGGGAAGADSGVAGAAVGGTAGAAGVAGAAGAPSTGGSAGSSLVDAPLVPGGTFLRSYDGATYSDVSYPAKVSTFRLDRFEVTVARFRPFVVAVASGWEPSPGAGKHAHTMTGGLLTQDGVVEPGWSSSGSLDLPAGLSCGPGQTWTQVASTNEQLPINCVSWPEAHAFCIWDGGFLPSEAEWNYAASGGEEQRPYPWGAALPDTSRAIYSTNAPAFVGSRPSGAGKWGHEDLAGNVYEWVLDSYSSYINPCVDCTNLSSNNSVNRGGGYSLGSAELSAAKRNTIQSTRVPLVGFRCARAP